MVVAGEEEVAKEVREIFRNEKLRVYITKDVVGVEVGGALKNIFAIGGGIVEGLGLGYNTLAALVTIGCSEMRRLALALGANPHTFSGLSGLFILLLLLLFPSSPPPLPLFLYFIFILFVYLLFICLFVKCLSPLSPYIIIIFIFIILFFISSSPSFSLSLFDFF